MKKLLVASALSAAFISPAVFAQAKNFEGFGLQISTGYQSNEVDASDWSLEGVPVSSYGGEASNSAKGGVPLNIGASYTLALTNRFTIGALVEYNPLSMKTGTSTLTLDGGTSTNRNGQKNVNDKLENQISISVVPGYAFTDTTMGYARVGWINATAKGSANDGTSFSANTNGILLGLGAKHLLTPNIYGFAEATYAKYSGATAKATDAVNGSSFESKLTPSSYSFLIGVGYRF